MTTTNDITGDTIASRANSKAFEDNYDRIFRKSAEQAHVPRSELTTLRMVAGNEKKYSRVILDGEVMSWAGIGWISEGVPTPEQAKTLPIVVD